MSNAPVQFSSSSEKEETYNSGNGQPYEGKPKIGYYYQVVPGFTCNGGTPSVASVIQVTNSQISLKVVDRADCSQSTSQLQYDSVESPKFNRDFLGYKSGIYKWHSALPDPVAQPSETWCRSMDGSFDIVVENPQSARHEATLRSAAGLTAISHPTRQQNGQTVIYTDGPTVLTVQPGPISADKTPGTFATQLNGKTFGGKVLCRSTRRNPEPLNYLVLTQDTTNANFGGMAGANAMCLSQVQTHPFKGKANVNLTAANVSAFLCTDSLCNNFSPNTIAAYARAGDASVGGQTFKTDALGSGPGVTSFWNTADVFGGDAYYWLGRGNSASGDLWPTAVLPAEPRCQNWTTNLGSETGSAGNTSNDWWGRWNVANKQCADSYHLLCIVRP